MTRRKRGDERLAECLLTAVHQEADVAASGHRVRSAIFASNITIKLRRDVLTPLRWLQIHLPWQDVDYVVILRSLPLACSEQLQHGFLNVQGRANSVGHIPCKLRNKSCEPSSTSKFLLAFPCPIRKFYYMSRGWLVSNANPAPLSTSFDLMSPMASCKVFADSAELLRKEEAVLLQTIPFHAFRTLATLISGRFGPILRSAEWMSTKICKSVAFPYCQA
jgi:hypothetical protein